MIGTSPPLSLKILAQKDHDSGRVELLDELKRIPKSELHNVDPTLLARLTPRQRATLFAQTDKKSHLANQSATVVKRQKRALIFRRAWNGLPLPVRSQLLGLLMTAVLSGLTALSLRYEDKISEILSQPTTLSVNTSTWKSCNRLTPYTDGCVYTVASNISWHDAAKKLGFDVTKLIENNDHLSNLTILQRGDKMTVWRNTIPLEN